MNLLAITQLQLLGISIEISLEIRDWHAVWMIVVYAETTTHINVLYYNMMSFQLVLQFVDTVSESLEVTHVKYLTTNMEVQS